MFEERARVNQASGGNHPGPCIDSTIRGMRTSESTKWRESPPDHASIQQSYRLQLIGITRPRLSLMFVDCPSTSQCRMEGFQLPMPAGAFCQLPREAQQNRCHHSRLAVGSGDHKRNVCHYSRRAVGSGDHNHMCFGMLQIVNCTDSQ